jgi:DNA-directed RNA polymerase specialized sigma24 family protein
MKVASSDEILFVDRLLAGWASWARRVQMPLVSQPSLTYSSGRDGHAVVLNLPDDEFDKVDKAIARLVPERRTIIVMHYCRSDYESKRRKATMCGMTLREYEAVLRNAQLDVVEQLGDDVYSWALP